MEDLQSIKKRIDSAGNLQTIVSTMKAHASSNINQFQNAANASMNYRRILDMGLYIVLSKDTEKRTFEKKKEGSTISVIFGSDHGLAGQFNERIASFALENIRQEEEDTIIIVGQQVFSRLENDLDIFETLTVPQTREGITSMVQKLLFEIDQIMGKKPIKEIILYYNKPAQKSIFEEEAEKLFPLDFEKLERNQIDWESNSIPTYIMDKEMIFSDLIQQYFFITLYRSLCYSLASENASRLASMQAAEKNIDERLDELNASYRRQRQNQITEEINDVISGFKSIRKSLTDG